MSELINEYRGHLHANSLVKRLYEQYARKLCAYTRKNYTISEDDTWTLVYKPLYKMAEVHHRYNFENGQKESAFLFKTYINYLRNYFRDNKTFESKNSEVELNENYLAGEEEIQSQENGHLKILQR